MGDAKREKISSNGMYGEDDKKVLKKLYKDNIESSLSVQDSDVKLEWMYKNSTELLNREEYLLGRKVDKSFEILQAEAQRKEQEQKIGIKQPLNHVEHECVPFSIRWYKNSQSNEQVDLQRKIMEDPLVLIHQREMECRRKILENPVKLKQLHDILKTEEDVKRRSNSKYKKNKRKKIKNERKKSCLLKLDGEENLDEMLIEKLKTNLPHLNGDIINNLDLDKLLNVKFNTLSKELDKITEKSKKNFKRFSSIQKHTKSRSSSSRSFSKDKVQKSNNKAKSGHKDDIAVLEGKSPSRRHRIRNLSSTYHKGDITYKKNHNRSSCYDRNVYKRDEINDAERDAKLREMMLNAEWREDDRSQKVKKYRNECAHEEKQNQLKEFDKNFINKEIKNALNSHTSIESRLQSNFNNIQRKNSTMNSNFIKK